MGERVGLMYYCASYETRGQGLTPDVRFMNSKKSRAAPPRRLASCFAHRHGDSVADLPIDQLGILCFGPVATTDQLALADFIAGQERSARGGPHERPDGDGTDSVEA